MSQQTTKLYRDKAIVTDGQSSLPSQPILVTWLIEVYRPGKLEDWISTGTKMECLASHPYTAIAQAVIGDRTRIPLKLSPNEIVKVTQADDKDSTYWLPVMDILIITEELQSIITSMEVE